MSGQEERSSAATPAGFHLLLRGGGGSDDGGGGLFAPPSGQRVVLLHGWMQSHTVWLRTAACLRDRYGHDVLLLDWWGHGLSHSDRPLADLRVEVLLDQLEAALARFGWLEPGSRRLCMGGISLGGALSLRFAAKRPERVARLTLVCSAGLSERWWALPSLTRPLRRSFYLLQTLLGVSEDNRTCIHGAAGNDQSEDPGRTGTGSSRGDAVGGTGGDISWWPHFVRSLFGQLRLIETTPEYGVPHDMPERLAAAGTPLHLVWGRLDWVHTAQVDRWRGGRPCREVLGGAERRAQAGPKGRATKETAAEEGKEAAGLGVAATPGAVVTSRTFPFMGHVQLCSRIDELELWKSPDLWCAPGPPGATKRNTAATRIAASRKDTRRLLRARL
jgi:pimeloyl-ACP methyl ester carboxylesterase